MEEGIFNLMSEKMDHLYAMQLAGYSTVSGLLFALLKQNALGRPLTEEELEESLLFGRQELADAYLESLQSREKTRAGNAPKKR